MARGRGGPAHEIGSPILRARLHEKRGPDFETKKNHFCLKSGFCDFSENPVSPPAPKIRAGREAMGASPPHRQAAGDEGAPLPIADRTEGPHLSRGAPKEKYGTIAPGKTTTVATGTGSGNATTAARAPSLAMTSDRPKAPNETLDFSPLGPPDGPKAPNETLSFFPPVPP